MPVYPTIVPNAGLTSPKFTAGTIAQGKMCREDTPLIYATLGTVADMRTGAYASGGIECERLHMAYARMAHCYNVPCGGYIGLTNSKLSDAQAGYETGMSGIAGSLAGMDIFKIGGLIDALKTFDFTKAVLNDEVALMMKRMKRRVSFSEEELAVNLIIETGPGGSFIANPHTVKRMKTKTILIKMADHDAKSPWEKKDSMDVHARAVKRVKEIMTQNTAPFIPTETEIDEKPQAKFLELVKGLLEPIS